MKGDATPALEIFLPIRKLKKCCETRESVRGEFWVGGKKRKMSACQIL